MHRHTGIATLTIAQKVAVVLMQLMHAGIRQYITLGIELMPAMRMVSHLNATGITTHTSAPRLEASHMSSSHVRPAHMSATGMSATHVATSSTAMASAATMTSTTAMPGCKYITSQDQSAPQYHGVARK